jgi:hypothetical protein
MLQFELFRPIPLYVPKEQKGSSFISHRLQRKEGKFCASGMAGLSPRRQLLSQLGASRHSIFRTVRSDSGSVQHRILFFGLVGDVGDGVEPWPYKS